MQPLPPILEFDGEVEAILEPTKLIAPLDGMPVYGVITFFRMSSTTLSHRALPARSMRCAVRWAATPSMSTKCKDSE